MVLADQATVDRSLLKEKIDAVIQRGHFSGDRLVTVIRDLVGETK